MRNRRTTVRFESFNGHTVHVILARDVRRTAKRLDAELDAGTLAAYVQSHDGSKRHLVFTPDADAGTVAHEASHAVRAMFAYRGVRNDNETFAYCLDYLVGRIHKFMRGTK